MWDDRKRKIVDHVRERLTQKSWNAHDFYQALAGLDDDLVDELTYSEAVAAGIGAVPGDPTVDIDPIADVWVGHLRKYAAQLPSRIAGQVADALDDLAPDEATTDLESVLAAFDDKLEALRSSVTRYAEPSWGAGWNGYGDALKDKNILMIWVLGDAQHCSDCVELADGSPYAELPTWPGMGDTQCLDRCKCTVQADPDSWAASLGGNNE